MASKGPAVHGLPEPHGALLPPKALLLLLPPSPLPPLALLLLGWLLGPAGCCMLVLGLLELQGPAGGQLAFSRSLRNRAHLLHVLQLCPAICLRPALVIALIYRHLQLSLKMVFL